MLFLSVTAERCLAQNLSKTPISKEDNCQASISQGISGKVLWYEGNMMPDPSKPKEDRGKGVSRFVYIYEPCKATQGTPYAKEFVFNLKAKLIKKIASDASGCFKVALPVGKYSVLVEEEKKLYANVYDGQNFMNLVEVKKGKLTGNTIRITYKAFF